jgi:hypothetical protein
VALTLDWQTFIHMDLARPIPFQYAAATCWHAYVRGFTSMVNSLYNSPRFEHVWLDR